MPDQRRSGDAVVVVVGYKIIWEGGTSTFHERTGPRNPFPNSQRTCSIVCSANQPQHSSMSKGIAPKTHFSSAQQSVQAAAASQPLISIQLRQSFESGAAASRKAFSRIVRYSRRRERERPRERVDDNLIGRTTRGPTRRIRGSPLNVCVCVYSQSTRPLSRRRRRRRREGGRKKKSSQSIYVCIRCMRMRIIFPVVVGRTENPICSP